MFRPNALKAGIGRDEIAFGVSHTFAHPPIAELMGLAGFDFVMLDAEHGLAEESGYLACLQALAATPATALLRLATDDPIRIRRALDLGAEAVMLPNVESGAQAAAIVDACRYPPRGSRGFAASGVRASDYGLATDLYLETVERELLIAVIIESARGTDEIEAIVAVDGVDVIQIGANDLSYSLGVPNRFDSPVFLDALERIERAARAAGKALGGVPLPGLPIPALIARGYRLITVGRDGGLLAVGLTGRLAEARAAAGLD